MPWPAQGFKIELASQDKTKFWTNSENDTQVCEEDALRKYSLDASNVKIVGPSENGQF